MRVELHPEARAELRAAALWHEERGLGLGDRLVERVTEALGRVSAIPGAYPVWPGTAHADVPIRRAGVKQFPYFVAYEIYSEHILVLAIAHGKRRPLYWLARATPGPG